MPERAVVVTSLGIVCALGRSADEIWSAILAGGDGLNTLSLFDSPRYGGVRVGQVESIPESFFSFRGSRTDLLGWMAVLEALGQRLPDEIDPARVGVSVGTTVGGMLATEEALRPAVLRQESLSYQGFRYHQAASTAEQCARRLGTRGPLLTFSTACSSGAMAIAAGCYLIESGDADVVLAGGSDSLCRMTLNGFGSLMLIDNEGCRPFDFHRAGISLGEGAAILVLESETHAASRGALPMARLSGWGTTADAWHPTAPEPTGAGACEAMRRALECAGLDPAKVDYINAHGTATPDNDLMESKAILDLFKSPPPISSTKRLTGHTLGAAGAIEAALCVLALNNQRIPPTVGFSHADPLLGLEPVSQSVPKAMTHALSNSFGFGGNNVSLVLSSATAQPRPKRNPAPENSLSLDISAAGAVSPYGNSVEAFFAGCLSGTPPVSLRMVHGYPVKVAAANDTTGLDKLPPARRRRLSRLQQMTLLAAIQCAETMPLSEKACVAVGTGWGLTGETAAFVENMIAHQERMPRPLHFTNSVHNALATQLSLEWGLKGLNSCTSCHTTSFEAALWHASCEIRSGTAPQALVGAADELTDYTIEAGRRWRLWGNGCGTTPFPGEGAAVFALQNVTSRSESLGRLIGVHLGRHQRDTKEIAEWIVHSLNLHNIDLQDIDVWVSGQTPGRSADSLYHGVFDTLKSRIGRILSIYTYKQWTGDHPSASAFGFLAGLGLLNQRLTAPHTGAPIKIGILTLCPRGERALTLVGK